MSHLMTIRLAVVAVLAALPIGRGAAAADVPSAAMLPAPSTGAVAAPVDGAATAPRPSRRRRERLI